MLIATREEDLCEPTNDSNSVKQMHNLHRHCRRVDCAGLLGQQGSTIRVIEWVEFGKARPARRLICGHCYSVNRCINTPYRIDVKE